MTSAVTWRRLCAGYYQTVAPERDRLVVRKEPAGWFRFRFLAPIRSKVGPFKTLAGAKDVGPFEEEE